MMLQPKCSISKLENIRISKECTNFCILISLQASYIKLHKIQRKAHGWQESYRGFLSTLILNSQTFLKLWILDCTLIYDHTHASLSVNVAPLCLEGSCHRAWEHHTCTVTCAIIIRNSNLKYISWSCETFLLSSEKRLNWNDLMLNKSTFTKYRYYYARNDLVVLSSVPVQ